MVEPTNQAAPLADPQPQQEAVAKIGDVSYETLQAAVDVATAEQIIVLQKDVALTAPVVVSGKNFTLDLGGFTLSAAGSAFKTTNSTVVVDNGTVDTASTGWKAAFSVDRGTRLTIAKDAIVIGNYGIGILREFGGDWATAGAGTVVDVYGTVKGTDKREVLAEGGTVGITISGNVQSGNPDAYAEPDAYAKINIHDGAKVMGRNGTSGGANADDGPAVYAAGYGEWAIADGATLEGGEALNIKSGKFVVDGGTLKATGPFIDPTASWGNGTEATGAAVSVTNHSGYARNVDLTINGGTFSSANGYALYEGDTEAQPGTALVENGLAINGGAFTGSADAGAVYVKNNGAEAKFVTGGTFSSDPTAYMAQGFEAKDNGDGTFGIIDVREAAIGDVVYLTLAEALASATDGDTVTLLNDVALAETLTVDKAITLDLGKKTITSEASGWALVFTNDATVTNGTILANGQGQSGILAKGGTVTIDGATVEAKSKALQAGFYDKNDPANQIVGHLVVKSETTSVTGEGVGIMVVGINNDPAADKSSLVVNGGTIQGGGFGIVGNGTYDDTSITLNGGIVRATNPDDNAGIYHPQQGELVINEGATVEGLVGVQMGGGSLVVNGGTLKSTDATERNAPYKNPEEGDGSVLDGSALSVVSRAGGYGDIAVEVKGGSFETANAANEAVKMYGLQKANGVWTIIDPPTSTTVSITGGTFANDPTAYVAQGYEALANADGTYTVGAIKAVSATVGGEERFYASLADAIADAQGEPVKMLRDLSEDVVIEETAVVSIDLNGFTLTNVSGDTISNMGGTLTISDSSEGQTGVVDCVTHQKAALHNLALGKTTITGGKLTRSAEKGTKGNANDNSWYTVFNESGALNVEGGTIVGTSGYSSLVRNGGTMLVSGGKLQQDDLIAVNNYSTGEFSMTGGEIVSANEQGIINWNKASITGGTITAKHAVASYADATDTGVTTIADNAVIDGTVRSVAYTNAGGTPSVQITGGEVRGALQKQTYDRDTKVFVDVEANATSSELIVTGGTFANDPSAYVADGYIAKQAAGAWTVEEYFAAKVGETSYRTLAEAFTGATDGQTVTLLNDVALTNTLTVDKAITLDLDGKTITSEAAGWALVFTKDATVTNGKILANGTNQSGILAKGGTVTIDGATVEAKSKALQAGFYDKNVPANQIVGHLVVNGDSDIKGEVAGVMVVGINNDAAGDKSSLVVNGGAIQGLWYGIAGNGTYDNTSIELNGGTVRATNLDDNAGIYHPQQGELVVNEGAQVSGAVGVQMAGGNIVVNGGEIRSDDTEKRDAPYKKASESDGSVADGAALSVVSRASGYGAIGVKVVGGTFTTANAENDAVKMYGFQRNSDDTAWEVIDPPTTITKDITGGMFSSDPTAYVAQGYEAAKNAEGLYQVQKKGNEAKIGEKEYPTLADAIALAKDGETVSLLKNVNVSTMIKKESETEVTLDLAGYTLNAIDTRAIDVRAGTLNVKGGTVTSNGAPVDDLAGKSGVSAGTGSYGTFFMSEGSTGTLNIEDCTLTNGRPWGMNVKVDSSAATANLTRVTINSSYGGGIENAGGTANVKDCVFTQQGYFDHCSSNVAVSGGGTLNVEGTTYRTDGWAVYVFSSGGTINVIDGDFAGAKGVLAADATAAAQSVLNVTGGKYLGTFKKGGVVDNVKVSLTGGMYGNVERSVIEENLTEDYECIDNTDEATKADYPYVVQMKRVAQVIAADGTPGEVFPNLKAAIDAAQVGETVKLIEDVDLGDSGVKVAAGKDLTLDLNGYDITSTSSGYVILNNGSLALADTSEGETKGSITGANANDGVYGKGEDVSLRIADVTVTAKSKAVRALNGATVTMTSGKLQGGEYGLRAANTVAGPKTSVTVSGGEVIGGVQGITIYGNTDGSTPQTPTKAHPVEVTVSGTAVVKAEGGAEPECGITVYGNGAKLNVEGGTITGNSSFGAVSGGGTNTTDESHGGTEINVSGGTITGGATDSVGIYHPQDGVLNVTGGTISGTTGIEMRAGALNVSGDAKISGGTGDVAADPNGNGGTTKNAAVAVAQHTTKLPIDVNISGGELAGGAALYESNPQNNPTADIAKVTMSVTGGKFKGQVYSKDVKGFLSGGLFSKPIDEKAYFAKNYEAGHNDDPDTMGDYPHTVVPMEHAKIGTEIYPTLEEAFKNVKGGEEIVLLKPDTISDTIVLDVDGKVGLNLNGNTVTGPEETGASVTLIEASSDLRISNYQGGSIDYRDGRGEVIKSYGSLELTDGVNIIGNQHANSISSLGGTVHVSPSVTISGGYSAIGLFNRNYNNEGTPESNPSAELIVNGGNLSGTAFAVSTNNLKSAGCEAVINNGTLSSNYTAIYWPSEGTVEVNGGTISGQTGIEMKMGDLVVNGGTIAADRQASGYTAGTPDKPYSGGSTEAGSGVYLVGKFYGAIGAQYREDPILSAIFNGGTISSISGDAIAVYEGDKDAPNAAVVSIPADKSATLTADNGKQIAYYSAQGVNVPKTRISALGIANVDKYALTYEGLDGAGVVPGKGNPAQVTKYDIVGIANPSQEDNTFKGWTITPEDSYNKGTAFNVVLQGVAQNTTLKAGWQTVQGAAKAPEEVPAEQLAPDADPVIGSPAGKKDDIEREAAKAAESLVKDIVETSTATGLDEQDAKEVQKVIETAAENSSITSTIQVTVENKTETEVQDDANSIKGLVSQNASVEKYVDLGVKLLVAEEGNQLNQVEVPLTKVDQPIPFSVKLPVGKLKNADGSLKGVQIATVHNGTASLINPERVDYATGDVDFYGSKFSTYAVVLNQTTALEPVYDEALNMFFANGTPITISENTGTDKAEKPTLITWGNAPDPKTKTVNADVSVFGGGQDKAVTFEDTMVTMKGGQVKSLFGGGLRKGSVVKAAVTIEGGTVASSVFGGGESMSVETATVTISGGDLSNARVTAGGSNGDTGVGNLVIEAGANINVVQGVDRGSIDSVDMKVNGGTIKSLYLGGETGDANVDGTINTAINTAIKANASVGKLAVGTSGGMGIVGQQSPKVALTVADTSKVGNFAEFAGTSGDNLTVKATIDLEDPANVVTFDPAKIPNQTYAGQSIKPAVKVYVNGTELAPAMYNVTYSDNVLPGKATITVRGNDYVEGKAYVKGTASTSFTIVGVDANVLQTAIAAATKLRAETVTADSGYNVPAGSFWAPTSAVSAYSQAIGRAEGVSGQTVTQAQMNDAVNELAKAGDAFKAARAKATVSKSALTGNINSAKQLRNATKTSSNGSDVSPNEWWATPLAMSTYSQAISKAEGVAAQATATQAAVDAAAAELAKATSTFNASRKPGTKTDVVAGSVKRLAGAVATGTSQAISQEGFSKSDYAVVVRNDGFHDAMSATGLAGAYNSPILLTETDTLSSETKAELQRLGVKTVFVIGGTAAISTGVENQIKGLGMGVQRIAGADAPDTSVQCAKAIQARTGASANAIMATSETFQDALSMASFAYAYKVPILLLGADGQVVEGAKPYLAAASKVYVPGGTAAVSEAAVAPYASKATRFAGADAFDTSNRIAEYMVASGLLGEASVGVANGLLFNGVDALAGSALMGQKRGVMLLADGDSGGATIDGFLKAHGPKVAQAYVFGGAAVVTPALYSKIESLVK